MKPKDLYRGITLNYEDAKNMSWENVDLVCNKDPLIDSHGRKTVHDGNEYGVYMSDNLSVASQIYAFPSSPIKKIENSPVFGKSMHDTICGPQIGILYHIDTEGVNIREPFICSSLTGDYNNNRPGKEWIADRVPSKNVNVMHVHIGSDILHGEKIIVNDGSINLSEAVDREITNRLSRLQELANEISGLSELERRRIDASTMQEYKSAFSDGGLKSVDLNNATIQIYQDVIYYMKAVIAQRDKVDTQQLKELTNMSKLMSRDSDPSAIKDEILNKLGNFQAKRAEKLRDGLSVQGADREIQKLENWLDICDVAIGRNNPSISLNSSDQDIDLDSLAPNVDLDDLAMEESEINLDSLDQEFDFENLTPIAGVNWFDGPAPASQEFDFENLTPVMGVNWFDTDEERTLGD